MNRIKRQLENTQLRFREYKAWTSNLSGRYWLACFLFAYFLPIFIVIAFADNKVRWWNSRLVFPFVPKLLPPFADLRAIASVAECIRVGYNVAIENPCDPWKRPFNYPPIWHLPADWGLNQGHTKSLGILLGLLFFIAVFAVLWRLNFTEAVIGSTILCSPSLMLAVERGNNDLLIFILLVLALFALQGSNWRNRWGAGGLIIVAAILKLYPIFAIVTFVKYRKRKAFRIGIVLMAIFFAYCLANWRALKLVSQATPRDWIYSYGSRVIFDALLFAPVNYLHRSTANPIALTLLSLVKMGLPALCVLMLVVGAWYAARQESPLLVAAATREGFELDAFRLGASLYAATFLLGNNWDYRLIFSILMLPQLFSWVRKKSIFSRPSALGLGGLVLTTWLSVDTARWYYVDETINWGLLFFSVYALLVTLPPTWKRQVGLKGAKAIE